MEKEKQKLHVRVKLELKRKLKKFGLHPTHSMHHLRQLVTDINGYELKYMGYQDTKNVAASLREGYELVRADEYPDQDYPEMTEGNTQESSE